ncbi:MAG: DUF354 domain-containing protein [Bacteroidales bacterium]|nr:DUF354 domain-containing protein [Bacteroidales bacterium]
MKYLIDIGHPAHVHYFKNFARININKGNEVLFTCRDKEVTITLLEHYNFKYINFGKPFKSRIGKILGLFYFTFRVIIVSRKFKPDLFLNASMYSAISAWILRKPHISLEDTFNMEQVRLYLPFSSAVLTGTYYHRKLGKKEISYNGFQELAYLHPKYFIPDTSILKELDIPANEIFFIIRFVSWKASHDIGHEGLSLRLKRELINILSKYGRVFISSENKLPEEFEQFKFNLGPDRMHHALAYANLYIGEGATMASECAVLGTTAIYINSEEAGLIDEHEKNELIYHFRDENCVIEKIHKLLEDPLLKTHSLERSKKMVNEKIDVTSFIVWFAENWPESFKIMKENPEYQERFK